MPGWSGWTSLNGGYSGDIEALGQNADGRLEILGLGPAAGGREVTHNWQTTPNGGWNGWASLGSPPQNDVLANVSVARNADGRLGALVRYGAMSAGTLWQAQQTAPNAGWTGWVALNIGVGHVTTGPCQILANADGRLELFAIGSPGGVTHAWQTAPNAGWSAQADLGSPGSVFITNVRLGRHLDGRLAAFSSGSDGAVWQISQTAANNRWGSWSSLGKPAADSLNVMVSARTPTVGSRSSPGAARVCGTRGRLPRMGPGVDGPTLASQGVPRVSAEQRLPAMRMGAWRSSPRRPTATYGTSGSLPQTAVGAAGVRSAASRTQVCWLAATRTAGWKRLCKAGAPGRRRPP